VNWKGDFKIGIHSLVIEGNLNLSELVRHSRRKRGLNCRNETLKLKADCRVPMGNDISSYKVWSFY
jgi:hypothetical protein